MRRSQTSLADALATPQLARACCGDNSSMRILHTCRVSSLGQGLKVLRLVSKELSRTMLPHIQHFTLILGHNEYQTNMGAYTLLQHTKLSSLSVRGAGKLYAWGTLFLSTRVDSAQ